MHCQLFVRRFLTVAIANTIGRTSYVGFPDFSVPCNAETFPSSNEAALFSTKLLVYVHMDAQLHEIKHLKVAVYLKVASANAQTLLI